MNQAHVFISSAREDASFVDELIRRLSVSKLAIWRDIDQLRIGADWQQAIEAALRSAAALVVVISPASVKSDYVTYEWSFALGAGVRVLPVRWDDSEPHSRLAALQVLDLRSARKPWLQLIGALQESGAKSRLFDGKPEICAAFKMLSGRPKISNNHYVVDLWIHGAPADVIEVTYRVHHRSFHPSKWFETSTDGRFDTWIKTTGDVLVSATFETLDGNCRTEIALHEALNRTHRASRNASIRKALRVIQEN
jgi:hypothetical protein